MDCRHTLKPTVLIWLSWLGIFLIGCQEQSSLQVDGPMIAQHDNCPVDETHLAQDAGSANSDSSSKAGQEDAAQYEPPFPDRVDLFTLPRRDHFATGNRRTDGGIELKGFVSPPDNQQVRAVISINGLVSPLAEGQEKYGIRVISIEQPQVVLERGSTRWTATLE